MAATYSKPVVVPRWADLMGSRVEPSEAKKTSGWLTAEKPPASYFNWLNGITGDWFKWLNERMADYPAVGGENIFAILNPATGGFQLQTIPAGGMECAIGLNVGFTAASAQGVSVGDERFKLFSATVNNKRLQFDTDYYFDFERVSNLFRYYAAGNLTLTLTASRFSLGNTLSTVPFQMAAGFVGTLGGTNTNQLDMFDVEFSVGATNESLRFSSYRLVNGTTADSAATYLVNRVGAVEKGWIRFSGVSGGNPYGIGEHVALGFGTLGGGTVGLYVNATGAYAHEMLPRSAGSSELGSETGPRQWARVVLGGATAEVESYSAATPPALWLQTKSGTTVTNRLRINNDGIFNFRDGTYLEVNGVAALEGEPSVTPGRGYSIGAPVLGNGLYVGSDGSVNLWRGGQRQINVYENLITLGDGYPNATASLRSQAALCMDFAVAPGSVISAGWPVYVANTVDHAVSPATTLGQLGIIGIAVRGGSPGEITSIAVSGIVQVSCTSAGITRGAYVRASSTIGLVTSVPTFGNDVIGVALETRAGAGTFRMVIRFGG